MPQPYLIDRHARYFMEKIRRCYFSNNIGDRFIPAISNDLLKN